MATELGCVLAMLTTLRKGSVTPASPSSVQYRGSPTRLPQATIDLILELRQETGQQRTRRREEQCGNAAVARVNSGFAGIAY